MNSREKELREDLEDKLYYNLYNPKDGVAQTNTELPDLNIDLSEVNEIKSLRFYSLSCSNCSQIAEGYEVNSNQPLIINLN